MNIVSIVYADPDDTSIKVTDDGGVEYFSIYPVPSGSFADFVQAWLDVPNTITPYPYDFDALRDRVVVLSQNEANDVAETGAPYNLARFRTKTLNVLAYLCLASLARKAVGPFASFQITGGTENSGVNKVTSITIGGQEVLGSSVDFKDDNNSTAEEIAIQINSYASSPKWYANAYSGFVYIFLGAVDPLLNNPVSIAHNATLSVVAAGDVTTGSVRNSTGGTAPTFTWFRGANVPVVVSNEGTEIPLETAYEAILFTNAIEQYYLPFALTAITEEQNILALPDNATTINSYDYETPYDPFRP